MDKREKAIMISSIALVVLIALAGLISQEINSKTYDKACKELGYNETTDMRAKGWDFYKFECDKIIIEDYLMYINKDYGCEKEDKWGDCEKYDKRKIFWIKNIETGEAIIFETRGGNKK